MKKRWIISIIIVAVILIMIFTGCQQDVKNTPIGSYPSEFTPSAKNPQEPISPPKYHINVTFDSASCEKIDSPWGDKRYRLEVHGHVNGSVGSDLFLSTNPMGGMLIQECSSWSDNTGDYNYSCVRKEGEPEYSDWTLIVNDTSASSYINYPYDQITVTASLKIYDKGDQKFFDYQQFDVDCGR